MGKNWQVLEIRRSHKYVGTWKHLDEHECLGRFYELSREELAPTPTEEEDMCDPKRELFKVRVVAEKNVSLKDIKQALRDVYSSHGCSCEHDCCGCRSYYAGKVRKHLDGTYTFRVSSSCNY